MTAVPTAAPSVAAGSGGLDVRQAFLEHGGFVLRAVRRCGVAERDVEDVAQEVFVVAHRRQASFDGRSSVRTWLFGIAMRVSSDHRRRAHVRREHPTETLPEAQHTEDPVQRVSDRQLRAQLDAVVAELDEDKRAVFVLYELEDVPMAEIAQSLGCPLFTAYSRLREARARVRARFEDLALRGGRP